MRKELPDSYCCDNNGNLLVRARNPELEIVEFPVERELLLLPYQGRTIELKPVIPKVVLLSVTPEMEKVMAAAGKGCYSRLAASEIYQKLSMEESQRFLREQIIPTGHHSVIEHGLFTFGIEDVSRAFTHQLVRHRIASYDQQSQRYCNPMAESVENPTFRFIVPPSLRYSEARFTSYVNAIKSELFHYLEALREGIKEEDARMFLPNASSSNIVMSMNARALFEMATKRTCALAQWEMDMVVTQLVILAYSHAPTIFEQAGPECSRTKCREGKRSCGQPIKPVITYEDQEIFPHDKLIFGMK